MPGCAAPLYVSLRCEATKPEVPRQRYSRICNDVDAFSDRVLKFTDDLINLGFKRDRLCNIYLSVVRRYRLKEKFGIVCGNILLP